jgi:hypothetical protein
MQTEGQANRVYDVKLVGDSKVYKVTFDKSPNSGDVFELGLLDGTTKTVQALIFSVDGKGNHTLYGQEKTIVKAEEVKPKTSVHLILRNGHIPYKVVITDPSAPVSSVVGHPLKVEYDESKDLVVVEEIVAYDTSFEPWGPIEKNYKVRVFTITNAKLTTEEIEVPEEKVN